MRYGFLRKTKIIILEIAAGENCRFCQGPRSPDTGINGILVVWGPNTRLGRILVLPGGLTMGSIVVFGRFWAQNNGPHLNGYED